MRAWLQPCSGAAFSIFGLTRGLLEAAEAQTEIVQRPIIRTISHHYISSESKHDKSTFNGTRAGLWSIALTSSESFPEPIF
jgi:hypothetical protein